MDTKNLTDQEIFDSEYITSSEIAREVGVSRTAIVHAKARGLLPNPIQVNGAHLSIWKREKVRPYINAWKIILDVRRAVRHE